MRRRLARLECLLGIDPAGRSRPFWLVPAGVLVGTVAAFLVIGQVTAAPLYVSLPNGIVIAVVMAGLAVACMTPAAAGGSDDPPHEGDDCPILGSPGGAWLVVAHLGTPPPSGPARRVGSRRGEPVPAGRR